ncbi:MAG: PhoH family protein [Planctomycetota bacterium]
MRVVRGQRKTIRARDCYPMEVRVPVESIDELRGVFGNQDAHAQAIRRHLGVKLVTREGQICILGGEPEVGRARAVVERLVGQVRRGRTPSPDDVERMLHDGFSGGGLSGGGSRRDEETPSLLEGEEALPEMLPRGVRPKSRGQERYLEMMGSHDITLVVGPAGTGKTFLAAAYAVSALKKGCYRRLILARPAVEAGEKLGFLPGDFQAKVNPYLRPLYDALFSLVDLHQVRRYLENDVIEIVPLAYMRGRTLDKAFIILDEAQNTTPKQMKMFLTRLGGGSRIVVTGDITQIDLPGDQTSGLVHCLEVLRGVRGIGIMRLGERDIVRHPLVQRIVRAYDRAESRQEPPSRRPRSSP